MQGRTPSEITTQRRRGLVAGLVALYATIGGAAGAADPRVAQRAEFKQAWVRAANSAGAPAQDSGDLRRYVLFPYLEAARLKFALRAPTSDTQVALDEQAAAFIRTHQAEPVAHDLRRAWLGSLAMRSRWQEFRAFHNDAADGAALRCHGFTARIELGDTTGLPAQIAQSWLTPRSLPDCERAFGWLESSGNLGAELVERRARLALAAGDARFARQIAARLPPEKSAPLLQWAALLENPLREIDALIAAPRKAVEDPALLAGWTKLARANRAAAQQRFERLRDGRQLDARAASPYALALALALSWDRDADALRYFALADAADFDDVAREWQARAALWSHGWKQAARSIAAMSEANRNTARWRYWAARASANDGDAETARLLYESILTQDNYYSAMAAARLNRAISPTAQPVPADAQLIASLATQPPFERARELLSVGLTDEARAEWRFAHESLPPTMRQQTIHLAAGWGWYHQAVTIATAERVFNDYALLYPTPFDAEVAAAAMGSGLPASLIYGVIRQESLYQSEAVSSADARGLMQLVADTARRTARQWNLPAPTPTSLFEPAINVQLGAAHLKDLLDRFDSQLPLALAAYNAGPGAAQRWLPVAAQDSDIWIENIPYNETRTYVQRILWHTVVFNWLREHQPQDTRTWLRSIAPRAAR